MSDKTARIHANPSNRAGARGAADRKVVFRSVLDNPFRVQWPSLPVNVQNTIFTRVLDMVREVSIYHHSRHGHSFQRKRAQKGPNARTRKSQRSSSRDTSPHEPNSLDDETLSVPACPETPTNSNTAVLGTESTSIPLPPVLDHLEIGINQVTKLLEGMAQSYRRAVTAKDSAELATNDCNHLVLVCRGDVNPPILIQHLPHLAAACNSRRANGTTGKVWLVPLPKGAELSLTEALGLRRACVMSIADSAPDFSTLTTLLEKIPLITAPWLSHLLTPQVDSLVPTHIKQLHTTAPKDMRAAKQKRAKSRAAARQRKRDSKKHPA
ncbi:uncharacterized protein LAESUDRAFT_714554 [Laetiporus sulphureus 93-53]|uniref:Uncharacterized protein n=1 Tax=Laetiporus sulphureus 93-53 TaxID=1314785 RepID=A0A165DXU8_9APHY|nr:uncharacterized protein LAESUDRAFT_714554 [Laetiporus sulphureus 93-53]KZT05842.1 hypothetical protein LAESUDRAFT_714554 [Laetiporus sulphureus 93-53]